MDFYQELIDMGVDEARLDYANGDYKALYAAIMDECSLVDDTSVLALNTFMTGIYLVQTQGSVHLWNLNERWYVRNPGQEVSIDEILRGFTGDFNGKINHFDAASVVRWPEVGYTFYVKLPYPMNFHRSSRIRSIKKVG